LILDAIIFLGDPTVRVDEKVEEIKEGGWERI
jgi:hypothetical protein